MRAWWRRRQFRKLPVLHWTSADRRSPRGYSISGEMGDLPEEIRPSLPDPSSVFVPSNLLYGRFRARVDIGWVVFRVVSFTVGGWDGEMKWDAIDETTWDLRNRVTA